VSDFRIDDLHHFCLDLGGLHVIPMLEKPSPKSAPKSSAESSARKKPAKSQPSSELAEFEVLPGPPKLSEFLTKVVIHNRNQDLVKMAKSDQFELAAAIIINAQEAELYTRNALGNASLAVVSAWNCGGLLNIAKKRMKHGEMCRFCRELRSDGGMIGSNQHFEISRRIPCEINYPENPGNPANIKPIALVNFTVSEDSALRWGYP
jgi:hypothetical protein